MPTHQGWNQSLHSSHCTIISLGLTIMLLLSLSLIFWAFVTELKGSVGLVLILVPLYGPSGTEAWSVFTWSLGFNESPTHWPFPLILLFWERLLVSRSLAPWKSTNHFGKFLDSQGFNLSWWMTFYSLHDWTIYTLSDLTSIITPGPLHIDSTFLPMLRRQ